MKYTFTLLIALYLAKFVELHAADTELSETVELPECHSLGRVSANVQSKDTKKWNGVLFRNGATYVADIMNDRVLKISAE